MAAGTNGSERDHGTSRQEISEPKTSEPERTSLLTYMAFAFLAISGASEIGDGIAMHDQSKMFAGGVEIFIAALAYFATSHRYRPA